MSLFLSEDQLAIRDAIGKLCADFDPDYWLDADKPLWETVIKAHRSKVLPDSASPVWLKRCFEGGTGAGPAGSPVAPRIVLKVLF